MSNECYPYQLNQLVVETNAAICNLDLVRVTVGLVIVGGLVVVVILLLFDNFFFTVRLLVVVFVIVTFSVTFIVGIGVVLLLIGALVIGLVVVAIFVSRVVTIRLTFVARGVRVATVFRLVLSVTGLVLRGLFFLLVSANSGA